MTFGANFGTALLCLDLSVDDMHRAIAPDWTNSGSGSVQHVVDLAKRVDRGREGLVMR